jgi:hypothetical protein
MGQRSKRHARPEPRRRRSLAATLAISVGLVVAPLAVVLAVRSPTAPAVGYGALMMGIVLELLWLTGKPGSVAGMCMGALALSLIVFLPFKREGSYSFAAHYNLWPAYMAGSLLMVPMVLMRKQLIPRVGEGSTLLHSLVFLYWMLDLLTRQRIAAIGVVVGAVALVLAAIHAWTELELSRRVRLGLSLWSAFVMLALAIQTVIGLIREGPVEGFLAAHDTSGAGLVFLEYLFLGTAACYMATNATLLIGYLPGRGTFFNAAYFRAVRNLNQEHIERFSTDQLAPGQATVVALVVGGFLALDWLLRVVTTQVAIWLVLTLVPWAMSAWTAWQGRRTARAAQPSVGPG